MRKSVAGVLTSSSARSNIVVIPSIARPVACTTGSVRSFGGQPESFIYGNRRDWATFASLIVTKAAITSSTNPMIQSPAEPLPILHTNAFDATAEVLPWGFVDMQKKAYVALRAALGKHSLKSRWQHWANNMLLETIDAQQFDILAGSALVYDALLKRFIAQQPSSSRLMMPEFARKWDQYIAQLQHHNINTSKSRGKAEAAAYLYVKPYFPILEKTANDVKIGSESIYSTSALLVRFPVLGAWFLRHRDLQWLLKDAQLHATIIVDADEYIEMKKKTDDDNTSSSSDEEESSSSSDDDLVTPSTTTVPSPPIGSAAEAASITDAPPAKQSSSATSASVPSSSSYTVVDDSDQVNLAPLSSSLPSVKPSSSPRSDPDEADERYAAKLADLLAASAVTKPSSTSPLTSSSGALLTRNIHILTLSTPLSRGSSEFGSWRIADLNYVVDSRDVDPKFDAQQRSAPIVMQLLQRMQERKNNSSGSSNDK